MEQLSLFKKNKKTLLLSLREEYYNKMLDGTKKYEYRTRYPKEETEAYIYISKTKKQIVAKIDFGKPIIGSKEEIANLSEKEDPGSYKDMLEYIHDKGYAIPVEKITKIKPVSLEELKTKFKNFTPPQSYYILDKKEDLLEFLKRR